MNPIDTEYGGSKEKCSAEDIAKAEKELGLSFSPEYKTLLVQTGSLSNDYFDVAFIKGPGNVVELTLMVRRIYRNLPRDLYALIDAGVDGIYILQNEKGYIFEIDDSDEIIQSSFSLKEYMERFKGC